MSFKRETDQKLSLFKHWGHMHILSVCEGKLRQRWRPLPLGSASLLGSTGTCVLSAWSQRCVFGPEAAAWASVRERGDPLQPLYTQVIFNHSLPCWWQRFLSQAFRKPAWLCFLLTRAPGAQNLENNRALRGEKSGIFSTPDRNPLKALEGGKAASQPA